MALASTYTKVSILVENPEVNENKGLAKFLIHPSYFLRFTHQVFDAPNLVCDSIKEEFRD